MENANLTDKLLQLKLFWGKLSIRNEFPKYHENILCVWYKRWKSSAINRSKLAKYR